MTYKIVFKKQAEEDILRLQKSGDKQAIIKLTKLLEELETHPTTGTGKPKRLAGTGGNHWSRRITDKHRLKYEIFENIVTVEVIQAYGHYDDK